jgi:predicted phosphodiesterase
MRLAVLADVHDNLPALEAVVEDIERHHVDHVIAAGDYLLRGPYPLETNHLLRSLDAWMIRGNTEEYLLSYHRGEAPDPWHTSDQWAPVRWTYDHLDAEALDFIASLPEQKIIALDGTLSIRLVHGSPRDSAARLIPERDLEALHWFRKADFMGRDRDSSRLATALASVAEPVLICGHTHIPWTERRDDRLVVNPGAVSGSVNEDPRAHYALLSWRGHRWEVERRAVPYDLDRVRDAFSERGFLSEGGGLARAFLLTVETGRNVVARLFRHIHRLAATAGCEVGVVVPEAIWHRAMTTFPWAEYDS